MAQHALAFSSANTSAPSKRKLEDACAQDADDAKKGNKNSRAQVPDQQPDQQLDQLDQLDQWLELDQVHRRALGDDDAQFRQELSRPCTQAVGGAAW